MLGRKLPLDHGDAFGHVLAVQARAIIKIEDSVGGCFIPARLAIDRRPVAVDD